MKTRNRKIATLFLLSFVLISCTNKKKYPVKYYEIGGFYQVSVEEYRNYFDQKENTISFISIKDEENCATCYGGSLNELKQYATDNHFRVIHLDFDYESETFIDDYNALADYMAVKNQNGIQKVTKYQDDLPVITSLPCLIFSNDGYIGLNVSKDFLSILNEYVYTI